MRLSTRMHGIADYLIGAALLVLPWISGFATESGGLFAMGFGAALIVNTLLANFEMGVLRTVQVPLHLWLDGIGGLLLALSPFLAGFDRTVWIPHVAIGLAIVLSALITDTVPTRDRRGSGNSRSR